MQAAVELLQRLGTQERGHARGSLQTHLIGTCQLLEAWGCATAVCHGGLFHSVYGTSSYGLVSLSLDRRSEIRQVIGFQAERLAFLFCVSDRPSALWNALHALEIRDRLTGLRHSLSPDEAMGLLEIECANCLEQGLGHAFLQEALLLARSGGLALRAVIVQAIVRELAERT